MVSDIWTLGNNKVNQFYYGDNISKLNFPADDFPTSPNVYSFTGLSGPYGTANAQKRRVPIPVVRDDFNWQVKSSQPHHGWPVQVHQDQQQLHLRLQLRRWQD